jgi:addiction module RelB/DinJ family antitoxin
MTTIQIRIDEKTKDEAGKIFNNLGIDMTTAIKLFLRQISIKKAFPFPIDSNEEAYYINNFHKLSESSLGFWKDEKDDTYQKFYDKKCKQSQNKEK